VKNLKNFLKKNFITGLLVVVPVAVTVYVLKALLIWIDGILGNIEQDLLGHYYPGLGIITLLLLILVIGIISANYIGNRVLHAWDRLMRRLPLVRGIYSTVKQMMETFSTAQNFHGVGLVEYPRKGCYSIGFITGQVDDRTMGLSGKYLSVFVPTTPNPTAGFLLLLPENEVRKLNVTVDQGMKYIVSLGLVTMNELQAENLLQEKPGEVRP
jgi:uncharacterized membrane protein